MERDELVAYCLGKPGADETYPWGEAELVAKVGGKAFAFIGLDGGTVGVKCGRDAAEAAEWRGRHPGGGAARPYNGPPGRGAGGRGRPGPRRGGGGRGGVSPHPPAAPPPHDRRPPPP